jgi:abortive infection alpha-like protein
MTDSTSQDRTAAPPGGSAAGPAAGSANGGPSANGTTFDALPGLARITLSAWWRTTVWSAEAWARAGSRLMRAAASGESPAELFESAGTELREYLRSLLGIVGEEAFGNGAGPRPGARGAGPASSRRDGASSATAEELRRRGAELLRRSADVRYEEDAHPAYDRILTQLAPDEGRILRLLALNGPQPSVDVRTSRPLNVGSELVAPGLSMIGSEAGCRNIDRVHAYLNNLYRLGLIWFSREPVRDRLRYQVLEAQPNVVEAMRKAGRGRTVRRSIHLTPFGEDFCETCLPLHTDEIEALDGAVEQEAEPGEEAAAEAGGD